MYKNEQFEEVGTIGNGELVLKIPGTDIKMPYSAGTGYVNEVGNVAHLALTLSGMVAEESGEPAEGMMGALGEDLREQLNTSEVRELVEEHMVGSLLHLFYSQEKNGKGIITLPGISGENQVDDESHSSLVLVAYRMDGLHTGGIEEVYGSHSQVAGSYELVSDRSTLEKEVLTLAEKANEVYDFALEMMKDDDF